MLAGNTVLQSIRISVHLPPSFCPLCPPCRCFSCSLPVHMMRPAFYVSCQSSLAVSIVGVTKCRKKSHHRSNVKLTTGSEEHKHWYFCILKQILWVVYVCVLFCMASSSSEELFCVFFPWVPVGWLSAIIRFFFPQAFHSSIHFLHIYSYRSQGASAIFIRHWVESVVHLGHIDRINTLTQDMHTLTCQGHLEWPKTCMWEEGGGNPSIHRENW